MQLPGGPFTHPMAFGKGQSRSAVTQKIVPMNPLPVYLSSEQRDLPCEENLTSSGLVSYLWIIQDSVFPFASPSAFLLRQFS